MYSLGGFTALVSAGGLPEQVAGVVLLNSAGQFGNPSAKVKNSEESVLQKVVMKPLKEIFQRIFLGFLFWQAKQPARIESVLKSVCCSLAQSPLSQKFEWLKIIYTRGSITSQQREMRYLNLIIRFRLWVFKI